MLACQFQTVAATAPFLVGSFAIDYAQLGVLIGLFRLPGNFYGLAGPARPGSLSAPNGWYWPICC